MKDLEKMISGLSKSGFMSGMAGGAVSGVITNLAMGKSSKKTKKMGKTALKAGALAAVGGLAWKAYKNYNNQKSGSSDTNQGNHQSTSPAYVYSGGKQSAPQQHTYEKPARQVFNYDRGNENRFEQIIEDSNSDSGQLLLMQAMISAAYADGHIDAQEQQRIFQQVDAMDLTVVEKASLFDELRSPKSPDEIVAKVPDAETGMEVYAASLLAIDESQTESQSYLDQLAMQLCIPSELRAAIHGQANQARLESS